MTLPGRLNHYEILEPIGSGGMGDVYRARDTKLGREVAIKVLPEAFSQNKERLARFEREAKTLAALNHPNLAILFGLEESDGTPFLVMELVEGETLAERIARGAIPMEELLPLFEQIAKGVEAAHEKKNLHRDLKPANIKITPDDDIKILDFGLAKAFHEEAPVTDSSQSPTLSRGTQLGAIMGTASYMSPEQARAKALDHRTDVWSFGCCLYEAVTGKKAFDGETVTDVLSAILEREPDWSALAEPTPLAVRGVLARCLTKDAARRYHHLADARLDLEGRRDRTEREVSTSISFRERLFAPLILGVILVASIAVWAVLRPDPSAPRRIQRFAISLPSGGGLESVGSAFSPDGSHLVFVGSVDDGTQLYVRPLNEVDAVPLRGTEGASQPFFSPDGKWVGFFAGRKLKKVPLAGGPALVIADVPGPPRGASWGPNDDIFCAWLGASGVFRVSSEVGNPESVTTTDREKGDGFHYWPEVLPGGRAFLFSSGRSEGSQNVEVQDLGTGERKVLVRDGASPRYASSGHLIFLRERALFAVPFDPDKLQIYGVPLPVLENLRGIAGGSAQLSLSRSGSLAYTVGARLAHGPATMVVVDRGGTENPLTSDARLLRHVPRLSPMERHWPSVSALPASWEAPDSGSSTLLARPSAGSRSSPRLAQPGPLTARLFSWE